MKTGYSFRLHDLHENRSRLNSSFFMSCFPWDLTGFSGRIIFCFSVIYYFFLLQALGLHCGEGNGTPLQYSCLENSMNGVAWKAVEHEVAEDQARRNDSTFTHWRRKWRLHCSCLENPRDRGAWWAAVYGDSQSQTQLKWLSSSSWSSLLLRTSILSASRGYSGIAVHWLFNPVILLM